MDCAIYLGAGRKRELVLASPILVAAGALGYDPLALDAAERSVLGAFFTPPLTRQPLVGAVPPRLARTTAGYLQYTGRRNPGLRQALRLHEKSWQRAGLPIVMALYAQAGGEFAEMAAALAETECVQGLDLHLPHRCDPAEMAACVRVASAEADVPCLVSLPFQGAVAAARACAAAGADGLVVAAPPYGRVLDEGGRWVYGPLHSPALAPAFAELVHQVAREVSVPVIGRGGIAELGDILAFAAAGAVAVQLDSLLLVQPSACSALHRALAAELARLGTTSWAEFLNRLVSEP